jgi:outer membrane lipoprotein-sorting protein
LLFPEVIDMKKSARWLPALIAPVVVAIGLIAVPTVANASSSAPDKSPAEVLALMARSTDAAYSGKITQDSNLGLPELPSSASGSAGSSVSDALELLTSSHSARVFVDGAQKQRVQVLDQLAERDGIRNGSDVWAYDSKKNAAVHLTLPSKKAAADTKLGSTTPAELAAQFVKKITPTTSVAVNNDADVAGRAAYELTLTPKTDATLVSNVKLVVDAATGVPLRVSVDARGQKAAAFTIGFSSIDFSKPAADLFSFTPPKSASVTTRSVPTGHPSTAATTTADRPTVTGTGWAAIASVPGGQLGSGASTGAQSKLLDELTTKVDGGRALQTSLVSVLLTNDGRILAGAVPVQSLESAAK